MTSTISRVEELHNFSPELCKAFKKGYEYYSINEKIPFETLLERMLSREGIICRNESDFPLYARIKYIKEGLELFTAETRGAIPDTGDIQIYTFFPSTFKMDRSRFISEHIFQKTNVDIDLIEARNIFTYFTHVWETKFIPLKLKILEFRSFREIARHAFVHTSDILPKVLGHHNLKKSKKRVSQSKVLKKTDCQQVLSDTFKHIPRDNQQRFTQLFSEKGMTLELPSKTILRWLPSIIESEVCNKPYHVRMKWIQSGFAIVLSTEDSLFALKASWDQPECFKSIQPLSLSVYDEEILILILNSYIIEDIYDLLVEGTPSTKTVKTRAIKKLDDCKGSCRKFFDGFQDLLSKVRFGQLNSFHLDDTDLQDEKIDLMRDLKIL